MKRVYFVLLLLMGLCGPWPLSAQNKHKINEKDYANSSIEMADSFRAEGKIYVVVVVIAVLMSCIIFYLVRLERKVSKLEKKTEDFVKKRN